MTQKVTIRASTVATIADSCAFWFEEKIVESFFITRVFKGFRAFLFAFRHLRLPTEQYYAHLPNTAIEKLLFYLF